MRKRIWAYLLTLVMVVGLFPVSVLAEDGMLVATEASEENGDVMPVEEDMESFQMWEVGKTEVSTEAELRKAIENAEGTKDNPTIITVKNDIEIKGETLTIPTDAYINIVGVNADVVLTRGEKGTFFSIAGESGGLSFENIKMDGSVDGEKNKCSFYNAQGDTANESGPVIELKAGAKLLNGSNNNSQNYAITKMYEGSLIDHSQGAQGGAVNLWNHGEFYMYGGTISNCHSTNNSGAVDANTGSIVIIEGGLIDSCSNSGNAWASAISLRGGASTLIINGGTIQNGKGHSYTPIYTQGNVSHVIELNGGEILNNDKTSNPDNPDVIASMGEFTLIKGGRVTGNTSPLKVNSSNKVFGKPVIDNVSSQNILCITDALKSGAKLDMQIDSIKTIAEGVGYTLKESDLLAFTSKNPEYTLYLDKAENKIKSAKAIKVTFNSNTDESETATQTVPFEIPTNLKENSFTKKDYTFTGWNTEKDGTGTPYEDGAEVSFSENTTLFAQWEEKKAVDVKIIADRDFMKGKGTVNFTVTTEPEEALSEVAVSCEHSDIDVTKNGDGTYSAYLPNRTETYTFVAEIKDSDYKDTYAECTVNVQKKKKSGSSDSSSGTGSSATEQEHSVSKADGIDNGKVKTDPAKAEKGDKVTVTVTPDEGYVIDRVVVKDADGKKIELTEKGEGEYTFTMPDSKVEIDANFAKAEAEPAAPEEIPAAEKIVLTINERVSQVFGNVVVNDVAPVIRGERTMLPIRFIAQALGAEVAWDDALNKVTITKDDGIIELYIGSPVAVVNGENIELDAPALIENSRTYLPLRFVAEHLGAKVLWDAETQQVTILPQP